MISYVVNDLYNISSIRMHISFEVLQINDDNDLYNFSITSKAS